MPSLPGDLAAPFNPSRNADGVLRDAGRASFAVNTASQPRPSLSAQIAVNPFTVSSDIFLHTKALKISAWGFQPFSDGNTYDYLYTPLSLPYDLALYKNRAGAGSIIWPHHPDGPSFVFDLGSATHPGYVIGGSGTWGVGAFPLCDTEKWYEDGPAGESWGSGDECDVSEWGPVTETYATYVYPSFRGYSYPTPATPFWVPTSNTFAEKNPDYEPEDFESPCPDSDPSVTLSAPCGWSDLVTMAATVMASAETTVSNSSDVWGNTGEEVGGTDGTRHMVKTVGHYRWQNQHANRATRIAWREALRRNTMSVNSGHTFSNAMRAKLVRTELTEPLATPYYDEWGAWAPGDWRWEAVGWRQFNWAYLTAFATNASGLADPSRALVDGSLRILGSRLVVELAAPAPANTVARVTLFDFFGALEVVDLPIEEGATTSDVLERLLVGAWTDPTTQLARIQSVAIRVAGQPATLDFVTLVKQRRALRIAGHAALISGDQLGVPARWRVKTRRTEWQVLATTSNGPAFDDGHVYQSEVTGEASLETVEEFDLVTGEALPMITTREGELNGEPWNPLGGHATSVSGTPTTTDTDMLFESSSTPAATSQFLRPTGRDEPDPNGEVLDFVDYVEDVPAASFGTWRPVNPSERGASVFIENRRSVLT